MLEFPSAGILGYVVWPGAHSPDIPNMGLSLPPASCCYWVATVLPLPYHVLITLAPLLHTSYLFS